MGWRDRSLRDFLIGKEYDIIMGGSGGKRKRLEARKQATSTIDGNFNSIGGVEEQTRNRELVVRLMGDIGPDGAALPVVTSNDRLFLSDCRIKLNQMGNASMFGWRQVESMVRIHRAVTDHRQANPPRGHLPNGSKP